MTGTYCDTVIDICQSNPCLNGGICSRISLNSFTCICQFGFTGPYCNIKIDPCSSNPCSNGATCIQQNSGYSCNCPLGYTGLTCSIQANPYGYFLLILFNY